MTNIPLHQQKDRETLIKRLKEVNISLKRFLKVDENKKAFELEWQLNLYTPEELKDYSKWGICGGDGLVPLEADKPEMVGILRKILPPTLEVITPRRQLPHFFFKIPDGEVPNRVLHLPNDKDGAGEIRAQNQYFVAAGTEIEFNDLKTGELKRGIYKILHDRPIAEISYQEFMNSVKPFLGKESDQNLTKEIMFNGAQKGTRHHYGIRYATRLIRYEKLDAIASLDVMKRWNQKCKPPMNENDLERMVKKAIDYSLSESVLDKKSFPDIKYETQIETQQENKFVKKPDKSEPDMGFALQLLDSQFDFKCPTDTMEILYYQDGIYVPAKCKIHETLEMEYSKDLKKHFLEEAIGHIERSNYIEREEINKFTNKIPIKNGLFNLLTREIEPFNKNLVYTFKLNIDYNPEAKCPNWLEFVKQVVTEDDIPLLQEIMGYCLLPAMPYHKMFWLYGTGRNGKGRIVLTLEHILGEESCANLNLAEFRESRRFSLCQLYGKLMNISSEPPLSKYGLSTTVLKMVTGQDTIRAEIKGKNERLVFTNVSKLFVLGNHFPKVEDNSLGWWDRVEVLKFPNSFEGEKNVPDIEKKWVPEEISGIFNWMLEGLYRLKENNGFSSSKSTEETKTEFMKVSDPFNAWIIERCIKIPSTYLINEEALTAYFDYCDEIGADRDSKRIFYEKMRQTPKVKEKQKTINGKNKRVFEGITLKTDEDQEQNLADLADLADLVPQEINSKNNIQVEKGASSASSARNSIIDVNIIFPKNQYPVCVVCHKIIRSIDDLINLDGKPCHVGCKQKLEKDRILK